VTVVSVLHELSMALQADDVAVLAAAACAPRRRGDPPHTARWSRV
jgi:hypothetical protein